MSPINPTLFHRTWSVRLLSALHHQRGARFVVLRSRLQISAESLSDTLNQLIEGGWVERNAGYGHPLRPEYVLTQAGQRVAPACAQFDELAHTHRVVDVAYRKWSAPSLVAMHQGAARFTDIHHCLGNVTPRALTDGLRRLRVAELIERRDAGSTTTRNYQLTRSGNAVANAARPLVAVET